MWPVRQERAGIDPEDAAAFDVFRWLRHRTPADVVLAARSNPSLGIGIISIESIIYALCQALRWRFADRFAGAEQAITELTADIQYTNG